MFNSKSKLPDILNKLLAAVVAIAALTSHALPLTPARNSAFETDEATWLSVDVAPNGETIVMEVLGDLYTLPIEGGNATPLTVGMAFDSQPVYSRDGKYIAYISDKSGKENVWVMKADGSDPKKLTDAGSRDEFSSPSWSPDGDHVIVSKTSWGLRTFEVWAYALEGGKGLRVTRAKWNGTTPSSSRHNALGAVYDPTGKYLYFARRYGGFGYNLTLPIWQIVRRELKTESEDMLTNARGSAFRPELSSDGRLLVYGTRFATKTGLRLRDLHSGTDQWLVHPVQRDDQESRFTRDLLPGYSFTPDDKNVVYTQDGRLWSIAVESKEVTQIPFKVSVNRQLGPRLYFPYRLGVGPVKPRLARDAKLSPDGTRFAFTALGRLYVFTLADKQLTQLKTGELFAAHPSWSPDGEELAFVSSGTPGGHVWRIRALANSDPVKLTEQSAYYSEPLWLPEDNDLVVFRAISYEHGYDGGSWGRSRGTDLVRISTVDSSQSLIRHARSLTTPHLGPDPTRLYLYKSPGLFGSGDSGLVSIRHDGTDLRTHLVVKGAGIYNAEGNVPAQLAQISPTGRHALVKHANQLYLFRLPATDLPSIETTIKDSSIPRAAITEVGADDFGWNSDGSQVYWTVGREFHLQSVRDVRFRDSIVDNKEIDDSESKADREDEEQDAVESEEGQTDRDVNLDRLKEEHESVQRFRVELYEPRYRPKGTVAFTNATVIPVDSDDPRTIPMATVLTEDGRITAVGKDVAIPDDATVMDLENAFVVPGYVDTHAHLDLFREVPRRRAWSFEANLAYGVTTAIDVQPSVVDIIEYEDMVKAGHVIGPRVLSTGPGVFQDNVFKSAKHAEKVLTRYAQHYGVKNIKAYIPGNREQRHWLLMAAGKLSLMPTAEGALDTKLDITHVIDGYSGNEHNLPVVGLYKDVYQLMADAQIAYTPTLLVSFGGPFAENYFYTRESPLHDPKLARFTPEPLLEALLRRPWVHEDVHVFDEHAAQALKIVRAGGKVGVGSHGQLQGLGYHWELWSIASGGFTNYESLRAATLHGAQMIGVARDVGSIEVGKLADLVILNSNPLEDIRATADIRYVVINGVVREGDTLNEIWPEYRVLDSPYWINQ